MGKRIVFITGTRADYGKVKPLIHVLENDPGFEVFVFVCGMHLMERFGSTYEEVLKDRWKNIYVAFGLSATPNASINLGSTVMHLSGYVENIRPDMIVVHGDRLDALAGAIVGAMHNIIVAHIEGGELSGTIDESIRHAISKFAHVHFVCTEEAKNRLRQMGEELSRIYVIGSPDIDVMLSDTLPDICESRERYEINFSQYAILMYHPVTTEYDSIGTNIKAVVDTVIESGKNYIVVYPNNDLGSEVILNEYRRFSDMKERIRLFPSLRFEHFLTFLKNADFIIGNSSAGIREAGVYGIPVIDIGTRQQGRYRIDRTPNVQHVNENVKGIMEAIHHVEAFRQETASFGDGHSRERFLGIIRGKVFWEIGLQKRFVDYDF